MTVTAAADAAVLLIDCGRISAPCSAACTFHTPAHLQLLQQVLAEKTSLAGKLGHLSGRTIRERLLSYLEEQAARTGRATPPSPSHWQALADYLCVDRSALSRTIGALQREGVLTVRCTSQFLKGFAKLSSLRHSGTTSSRAILFAPGA